MKTAKLFLFPLRQAKSRRDGTLLTVCFSLRIFSLREISLALMIFSCASLHAQVTIGGLEEPHRGSVLDLNSTIKGGLLLSNVVLDNLYTIPATFPGMSAPPIDVKEKFTGALVYHEGGNGISAGIYVWNGTNWTSIEENCMPLGSNSLKLTPEIAFAKTGANVTFSVSSGASFRCAADEEYEWYSAVSSGSYSPTPSETSTYPASTRTDFYAAANTYKVKVDASNRYGGTSSKVSSNEATVYVTADGELPTELVNGDYRISGAICYDVKATQNGGESPADYAARVDAFANGNFTKTFQFIHTKNFTNLSILMPDDPVGIVASVSQPADNFGSGESSVSFTVTFDSNVKQLVKENNAPVVLKLLASYTDNTFKTRMASLNIRVQDAACYCPALVPTSIHPSGWLTFMCRNLGADYEIRSVDDLGNIDVNNFREYHGDWYRFGVHTASLVNNGQYEGSSTISNWTTSSHTNYPFYEGNTNWPSAESGAFGNPCPDGWRLPTYPEWRAVINMSSTNNTIIRYVGTVVNNNWIEDNSATPSGNYNNILRIGDHLFLPAAGYRLNTDGKLTYRGYGCFYWSSTYAAVDKAYEMYAYSSYNKGMGDAERSYGFSVRCVQAE